MKARAPKTIGELLVSAVPQLRERLVEIKLAAAWPSIVGADVARRARPAGVRGGTLAIVVDNSPWLAELTLRTPELTANIGARFPEITAITLRAGTLPAHSPHSPPPRPPAAHRLTDADRRDIEDAVAPIADPTLAAAARRLMTRARRFSQP